MKLLKFFQIAIICIFVASCEQKKAPEPTIIKISSSPEKAKVFFKGKELGLTPFEIKVPPGTFIFEIEKQNYKPKFIKTVVSKGELKNLEVNLEEITASVMIDSTPQEAIVEINGKQVGQTPIILHEQRIGSHSAILAKPGMVPVNVSWKIEDGRPQIVKANLSSNMGVIKINASPEHAQIYIDGKPKGKSPLTENIEQGEHTIRIEASGYEKHEQTVLVERTAECTLNIALNVLPATINITTQPEDAIVSIDGKQIGKAPLSVPGLRPGKYRIRAEKQGFDAAEREIELGPGSNIDASLILDTNMGGIDLIANPPGLTVYLNGKKIGKTEKGDTEKLSKVFEIRGLTFGKHIVRVSHARARPQDQIIELNIPKGQIIRPPPINMWVVDTVITFKTTKKKVEGRIREETNTKILFEPEAGVAISYEKEEILSIERLKIDEY